MTSQPDHSTLSVDNNYPGNNSAENNQQTVLLIGNPNVGKSLICAALTGTYSEVSNYPGTTTEIKYIKTKEAIFIDTPGIYGLGSYTKEEAEITEILKKTPFITIINIVCAYSLERDLFLTQQLIDMGYKVTIAVNQMDEAKVKGIDINIDKLSNALGVNIFPTIATNKTGISELQQNLTQTKPGKITPEINTIIQNFKSTPRQDLLLALEGDNKLLQKYSDLKINTTKEEMYSFRRNHINSIISDCVSKNPTKDSFSTLLGRWLLNPVAGSLVAIFVLFLLYQFVGVFVSTIIVEWTGKLIDTTYIPWIKSLISWFNLNKTLTTLLAGEYGVFTLTIQYLLGILVPLVIGFYLFFSILEDSGYLPRLAVLCDNLLSKIGLNGKSIIPILLGFGCVTMAVISSKLLNSSKERMIAIAVLALTVPCSAQLALIVSLLAVTTNQWLWFIYIITIILVMLLVTAILNKFVPGESSSLMIDLPPMRLPDLKNVAQKTLNKTGSFLYEATPIFFLGTLILGILQVTGGLDMLQDLFTPVVVNVLHLPKETTNAFIMGIIRREFGAVQLADMAGLGNTASILSQVQIVVSLVVLTLFVPCLAAFMVIIKERGWLEASILWIMSIVIAVITGGILSFLLNLGF